MAREFTYGPFKSRRLGLSLGIDVLPKSKKCTYNCVYCEIGSTSMEKSQLVSPSYQVNIKPGLQFPKELKSIFKYVPHLDSLTFGYNGEPTLNHNLLKFLEVAQKVRGQFEWEGKRPIISLFTNSSTMGNSKIREKIKEFEVILAKLDSATEKQFKRTNRPHPGTPSIKEIIESLTKLRKELPKGHKLTIQTLLYESYNNFPSNNNEKNFVHLARAISKIRPHKVQIYSIARIPAEYYVHSIDNRRKQEVKKKLEELVGDDTIKIQYF